MKHNGFYEEVEALLKDSEFQNSYDTRAAELKAFERAHQERGDADMDDERTFGITQRISRGHIPSMPFEHEQ